MNAIHPPGITRSTQEALVNNSVQATILSIVSDHIRERTGRVVEVEPEDHLFTDLRLDSLDRVDLCMRIEERFHLKREIREGEILTVSHLISAVERIDAKEKCDG